LIAAFVYLLAIIGQVTFSVLGERAAISSSKGLIESVRSRSTNDFLSASPTELLGIDIDHIMEKVVSRPKELRRYFVRWVPRVAESLISLILMVLILIPLFIAQVSSALLIAFLTLSAINILWKTREVLGEPSNLDFTDLEEPSPQESNTQESEEGPQSAGSLGRIKEIRWTDCEIVIDEDQMITFPWGIASSGKLTFITGLGKKAKSALLETLIGIQHPHQGRLFLETSKGIFRFEELDHSQLRSMISWLPKKPHFISGTIEENFRLIKPRANREKFKEILTKVDLSEDSLPNGIKTMVDEETMTQVQLRRLALARVLLKEAPIVLAEDDSTLQDQDLRTLINETLKNRAREGEMVICVSDDEELRKLADRILTIDSDSFTPTFVLESVQ
jgi:ABC-type transport system involved in cytochrome bd biosynthesis fused ATPase/permease subunit